MNIKKWIKQFCSVMLSAIIICLSVVSVLAETSFVQVLISPTTYSSEREEYVLTDKVVSNDVVFIKVTVSTISNLGGMAFSIKYDPKAFSFLKTSSVCLLDTKNSDINYYDNTAEKVVNVNYYSASYNEQTSISGAIFYIAFSVKKTQSTASYSFDLEISDLYDNSKAQEDITVNSGDSCSIKVVVDTIPTAALEQFEKLENITYPDSKADIDTAVATFNSFTDEQKSVLIEKYPNHYEWLSTAKTRYNRLAEEVSAAALASEISSFKKEYADVLALEVETVALSNESRVSAAENSYENLSSAAKTHLQAEGKLISKLADRISKLAEIKTEVDEFLTDSNYSVIWDRNILEDNFNLNYEYYLPYLQTALLCYDLLSDEAKTYVKTEYEWLQKMNAAVEKYSAEDEKAAILQEKISEFQSRYLYVFTLNKNNVGIEDKSAIEMVVSAYDALEDSTLKKALYERIEKIRALLSVIEKLSDSSETAQNDADTNSSENSGSEDSTGMDSGSSEDSVIIEITNGSDSSSSEDTLGSEVLSNNDSSDAKTDSVIETVIKVITKDAKYGKTILILFVLLTISILTCMVICIFSQKYQKKTLEIMNEREIM